MKNSVKPNNEFCIHELFLPEEDSVWIKTY